jgi:hypothetical protein
MHPDGASVVAALQGGLIIRSDLQGRELGRLHADDAMEIHRVAVSPDGTMLAVGLSMHGVRVLDSATGRVIARIPIGISSVQTLAFTDDSRRLISGSWWGVSVDDPRTGRREQRVATRPTLSRCAKTRSASSTSPNDRVVRSTPKPRRSRSSPSARTARRRPSPMHAARSGSMTPTPASSSGR